VQLFSTQMLCMKELYCVKDTNICFGKNQLIVYISF
jgi:hypothetical protein